MPKKKTKKKSKASTEESEPKEEKPKSAYDALPKTPHKGKKVAAEKAEPKEKEVDTPKEEIVTEALAAPAPTEAEPSTPEPEDTFTWTPHGQKHFRVQSPDHDHVYQEPDVTVMVKRLLNNLPSDAVITITRVE